MVAVLSELQAGPCLESKFALLTRSANPSLEEIPGRCAPAGEISTRGTTGRKPEESKRAIRDGWYCTGDMGFFDESNLLHLTDRLKDMIVTGGENVYSTEVENALASHPAVLEVAVIGIPSDVWGETVHAIVVLREDEKATAEELIEYARKSLAGFKCAQVRGVSRRPAPAFGRVRNRSSASCGVGTGKTVSVR